MDKSAATNVTMQAGAGAGSGADTYDDRGTGTYDDGHRTAQAGAGSADDGRVESKPATVSKRKRAHGRKGRSKKGRKDTTKEGTTKEGSKDSSESVDLDDMLRAFSNFTGEPLDGACKVKKRSRFTAMPHHLVGLGTAQLLAVLRASKKGNNILVTGPAGMCL